MALSPSASSSLQHFHATQHQHSWSGQNANQKKRKTSRTNRPSGWWEGSGEESHSSLKTT